MKKEFALFFVFLCIILPIKGQIVIDTSPIKPYDMGPALSVLNSYNNAFSRAMDQFSSYYDKAQEYYRDGNYTAAKTYLERCNQLNSRFRCASEQSAEEFCQSVIITLGKIRRHV